MKRCKRGHEYESNRRYCPDCAAVSKKNWRKNNKSKAKAATKRYQKRIGINTKYIQRYQTTLSGTFSTLVSRAKFRTKSEQKKKKSKWTKCDITKSDLFNLWESQNGRCAITNLEMVTEYTNLCRVSLDRINSNKCYVIGNIQLVCKWVNLAKNSSSDSEIKTVLQRFKNS